MVWIVLQQVFCSGGMKGFWGGHQGPVWQRQIPRWNLFQWKDLLKTNPLPGIQFLMKIYIGINNIQKRHKYKPCTNHNFASRNITSFSPDWGHGLWAIVQFSP